MWALIRRPTRLARACWSIARPSLRSPRDLAAGWRAAIAACYLARRFRCGLIHAQFAGPAAAGAYVWSRLAGVPFTVRAHAYDIYRPYAWAGEVLRAAAAVIAISDHGRAHIGERWGLPAEVIHVGVPIDSVVAREQRPASTPFRFVSVGALAEKKGHAIAMAALRRLLESGLDVRLDIVGEGPLRVQLERLADGDRIRLMGHLPAERVRAGLREYDAMVLASVIASDGDIDGIPVALMEAMLAGLPVVATTVAGIPELVRSGETGTLVEPTVDGAEHGMRAVVERYPDALAMTEQARELVESAFNVDRAADALVAVWRQVASGAGD